MPPVRTVVRLADLSEQSLRRSMVENFILTGETSFALENILEKVARLEGQGFFVLGNYGSGKSHLLNVLSLVLSEKEAGDALLASGSAGEGGSGSGVGKSFPPLLRSAQGVKPLVVEISLVEHSNREYLEQIVFSSLRAKLKEEVPPSGSRPEPPPHWGESMPRKESFQALRDLLREGKWGGLVLLMDELSEFLRSKEDSRSYNEDVRFLQYLGEFSEAIPCWVVAALQENIENTGSLSGELLHKIKDRYPARFKLTGEHVKEIVSRRLIRKTEKARETLPQIYEELLQAFGELPFSAQAFYDLYPVHPQTVELLDELRPFFSQHRGIVDFIHYRLAGDRSRGIPPFLENPPDRLLTPDLIFDHFRDRIRETVETNPYSDRVYRYYEREIGQIFPDEEDAAAALRIVKLLIIGTLPPAPKHFTAGEVTRLLLYRYTDLESKVNYDYAAEILEKLLSQGAFVEAERDEDGGPKRYRINPRADTGPLIKKKLEQITGDLTPGDYRPIHRLLPWLDENYLPLHRLQKEPFQEIEITWQNTKRWGKLLFCSPAELSAERLEAYKQELAEEETDFVFLTAPPAFAGSETEAEEKQFFQLLKGEKDEGFLSSLILWLPRKISADEEKKLQQAYAYQVLFQEYTSDSSPSGQQVRDQLQGVLEDERRKVREIFRNLYFQGQLEAGEKSITPEALGYLHFDELLARCAAEALKVRFPRHYEIRPQGEQVTSSLMQRTLDMLSSPHIAEESLERGPRFTIENYLKPLGLVKKRGQSYVLEINPRNSPLAAEFFALVGQERVPLQTVYRKLRKGPFGLSQEGFRALGLAAVLSGAASAYQGGKRLPLSKINYYRFWNIEEVGPGTLIRPELQGVLADVPFLPPKLKAAPLTFSAQQAAWEHVISFKEEWEEKIREITQQLRRLEGYRLFSRMNWEKAEKILERFGEFLGEIKVSYSSQEGLERFLAAFQSRPFLAEDFARLEALHAFFSEDLGEILRLGHYLKDPQLHIPTEEEQYGSLLQHYRLLQEFLEDEALFFNAEYRQKLKKEFKHFQDEYISRYLREHAAAVGPESLKPYRDLMESTAYRLLEVLGGINTLVVEDDIFKLNRHLQPLLARECRAVEEPLLQERPLCACGFKLGGKPPAPLVAQLEARIWSGIRSYLQLLQQEENRTKIESYAEHLEMVGKRREAAPLREILKILPADPDPAAALSPHLSQKTVGHINRALTGDAVIAERSLETLSEKLSGRVLTPGQLKEIISNWLTGSEEKEPDYIRIKEYRGEKQASPEAADPLERPGDPPPAADYPTQETRAFLEGFAPDLLPLYRQAGEELLQAALFLGWLRCHEIPLTRGWEALRTLAQNHHLYEDEPSAAEKLAALGEAMLKNETELPSERVEKIGARIEKVFSGAQLLELQTSDRPERDYNFDRLLEKLHEEPLFFSAVLELCRKLAAHITAEEIEINVKVMKGALEEVKKSLLSHRANAAGGEALRERKRRCLERLVALCRCGLSLRALEKALHNPPENDKHWEELYRQIACFEKELSCLEEASEREIFPDYSLQRWKHYFFSSLEPLQDQFGAYCQNSGRKNTLSRLLREYHSWVRKRKDVAGAYLIILDGARLDVWEELLSKMQEELDLRVQKEGISWAHQPSVTEAQLDPLREEGLLGGVINAEEWSAPGPFFDSSSLENLDNRRNILNASERRQAALQAVKFNFIDDKFHTSRDSLPTLVEEVLLASRKKLWPLLEAIPSQALLLVLSDHGFKSNPHHESFQKTENPRYLHGECSLFETLAPWALLEKR